MSLDDLPRGVPGRDAFEFTTPKAAWKDPAAVADDPRYVHDSGRLLIGLAAGDLVGIRDDRHAMLVAGSRAGKGRAVIVPNLLEYIGSVLAIDPKGELANITARRRGDGGDDIEGLGQRVAVLDPFDRTAPWVAPYKAAYNPLSLLDPDSETIVEDAGLIGDALVIPAVEAKDPHWDDSARNFIEGVILHVATSAVHAGRRNLITVWQLIEKGTADPVGAATGTGMDNLEMEMEVNAAELSEAGYEDVAGAIAAAAADFFDKHDEERMSVLSTARRHVKFLGLPRLREVLSGHDFDLTDLKTAPGGMTVYLCLPAGRMGTCNRWLRLFVNLALEAMEREERKAEPPVLLCLDEFASLGHMKQIEDAAGQIAGFGVKLWPILQDLTQLKGLYKERWETFLGNAGVIQLFGNNDATTLEWASKRLGKTTVITERGSHVPHEQRRSGATGESWGPELHDLLTPDEVGRYFRRSDPRRRQLVLYGDDDPLIVERVNYDEHPYFEGKFDPATRPPRAARGASKKVAAGG